MSLRARQAVGSLLSISLVLALVATARSAGPLPRLTGPALAGPTHLHLVITGVPPYIFDVDTNALRPVPAAVNDHQTVLEVQPSGNGALAMVEDLPYRPSMDALRIRLDGSVQRLASGRGVVPAHNSPALWVIKRGSDRTCRARLVPSARPSVRVPCAAFLREDTAAGLLMSTASAQILVDKTTGRVRASNPTGVGVVGRDVILERYRNDDLNARQLRLVDLSSGAKTPVGWPSILGWHDYVLPQPHGTLVAVGFADPAYPGPAQALDVWILDTATGKFSHLPGFPAQVRLKFSSMAWTVDDRLVLLLEGGGRTVLAVWKPGSKQLPLREVHLPEHTGNSATFVPLVSP